MCTNVISFNIFNTMNKDEDTPLHQASNHDRNDFFVR